MNVHHFALCGPIPLRRHRHHWAKKIGSRMLSGDPEEASKGEKNSLFETTSHVFQNERERDTEKRKKKEMVLREGATVVKHFFSLPIPGNSPVQAAKKCEVNQ